MRLGIDSGAGFLALACAVMAGCSNPVQNHDEHHDEITGVEITTPAGEGIASYAAGAWTVGTTGDEMVLNVDQTVEIRIRFVDDHGHRLEPSELGAEYSTGVVVADPGVVEHEVEGETRRLTGVGAGTTTLTIRLLHGSHIDWETTTGLSLRVVEPL